MKTREFYDEDVVAPGEPMRWEMAAAGGAIIGDYILRFIIATYWAVTIVKLSVRPGASLDPLHTLG